MGKDSFVKDALVLTVITLVSGLLLGAVYGITKEPIAITNREATNASYRQVMSADEYDEETYLPEMEQAITDGKIAADNGNALLLSVVAAKDASGQEVGYVVKGSCTGYGGADIVVVGITPDCKVNGISFPEALPETPGLGQKATEPDFMNQFSGGVKGMGLSVKKGGGAGDTEIDAISGATITSTAVTNTVNAATQFVNDYIIK